MQPSADRCSFELPPEDQVEGKDMVGEVVQSLYGVGARVHEQRCLAGHLEELGFATGRYNACVFCNSNRNLSVLVHGVEHVVGGHEEDLK